MSAATSVKKVTKAKEATHPPCKAMVKEAINNLKDRKGSSLQGIKKYIAANYNCDVVKLSSFIRKALVSGVSDGVFNQVKGTGARGSFKSSEKAKTEKADKPKKATKPKADKPKTPKMKAIKAKKPKSPAAIKPKKVVKIKAAKPLKAKTPKKITAAKKSAKK